MNQLGDTQSRYGSDDYGRNYSPGENHRNMPGGMGGSKRATVNGMQSMSRQDLRSQSPVFESDVSGKNYAKTNEGVEIAKQMQDTNHFLELLKKSTDEQVYYILIEETSGRLEKLIRHMSKYELQGLLNRKLDFLQEKVLFAVDTNSNQLLDLSLAHLLDESISDDSLIELLKEYNQLTDQTFAQYLYEKGLKSLMKIFKRLGEEKSIFFIKSVIMDSPAYSQLLYRFLNDIRVEMGSEYCQAVMSNTFSLRLFECLLDVGTPINKGMKEQIELYVSDNILKKAGHIPLVSLINILEDRFIKSYLDVCCQQIDKLEKVLNLCTDSLRGRVKKVCMENVYNLSTYIPEIVDKKYSNVLLLALETDEKSAAVLCGTHDVHEKISVEKLIYLKGIGDKELLEKWLDICFKEIDGLMVDPTKMTQEKFKSQLIKALEMDEKALEVLCSTGPGKDFLKYLSENGCLSQKFLADVNLSDLSWIKDTHSPIDTFIKLIGAIKDKNPELFKVLNELNKVMKQEYYLKVSSPVKPAGAEYQTRIQEIRDCVGHQTRLEKLYDTIVERLDKVFETAVKNSQEVISSDEVEIKTYLLTVVEENKSSEAVLLRILNQNLEMSVGNFDEFNAKLLEDNFQGRLLKNIVKIQWDIFYKIRLNLSMKQLIEADGDFGELDLQNEHDRKDIQASIFEALINLEYQLLKYREQTGDDMNKKIKECLLLMEEFICVESISQRIREATESLITDDKQSSIWIGGRNIDPLVYNQMLSEFKAAIFGDKILSKIRDAIIGLEDAGNEVHYPAYMEQKLYEMEGWDGPRNLDPWAKNYIKSYLDMIGPEMYQEFNARLLNNCNKVYEKYYKITVEQVINRLIQNGMIKPEWFLGVEGSESEELSKMNSSIKELGLRDGNEDLSYPLMYDDKEIWWQPCALESLITKALSLINPSQEKSSSKRDRGVSSEEETPKKKLNQLTGTNVKKRGGAQGQESKEAESKEEQPKKRGVVQIQEK